MKSGGGWKAIFYTVRTANRVVWSPLWHAMRSNNACKTCALGMGGQQRGMVNENPEVCMKSLQAMASAIQTGISREFFARYSIAQLRTLSPRELESCGRLVDPIYADPGRLPAPQRPRESRGDPEAGPGACGGVRPAPSDLPRVLSEP